jgi:hypothetical protein
VVVWWCGGEGCDGMSNGEVEVVKTKMYDVCGVLWFV